MELTLSDADIIVLQSLDLERGPAAINVREGDVPKKLFEFNLVSRQPGGQTVITKSGQRALFQRDCVRALEAIERGEHIALGSGVEKWLLSNGFVKEEGSVKAILPRGRLWLNSFEPDTSVGPAQASAGSSAAAFAARRS